MEWLIPFCLTGIVIASRKFARMRQVTFEVTTRDPLPIGEQIFVTGNQDALGHWSPDGFPLTRVDENLWSGTAYVPADQQITYKVTRGSWDTEEITTDGAIADNSVVEPGSDQVIHHAVAGWKQP